MRKFAALAGSALIDDHGSVPTVFVTRSIAEPALERLRAAADVDLWPDATPPSYDDLVRRIAGADAVVSMVTDHFDAHALERAVRLRVISNLAVGVDNIDLHAATARGIAVGHTPGVLTETTADLAFALLLAAARRVAEGDRYVRAGLWKTWSPNAFLGRDVFGATLGIVGFGAIGQAVARRAIGFNMRVLAYTRNQGPVALAGAQAVELNQLLAESDFISLHIALTPDTRHLIGVREFAMMKSGAILINTARGAIVDQKALLDSLMSGHLGGAGLDVAEVEPIKPDDPLLRIPNVVITPHIGSASHATRLAMAEIAVDNILDVFAGRLPRHCANPQVKLRA